MPPAKSFCVGDQLFEPEADSRVISRDYRAGADADDRLDWYTIPRERTKNTHVRRASQSTGAQHQADANPFRGLSKCHASSNRILLP